MTNKRGFTLLELLIAAAILGLLAVIATTSYRSSAVDTRITAAKMKTDQLAAAVQRFNLDHPSAPFAAQEMGNVVDNTLACAPNMEDVRKLILCDYVDNGGWQDAYAKFYVCNGDKTVGACANTTLANPLACMSGRDDHPHVASTCKYMESKGYAYCVGASSSVESLATGC